MKRDDLLTREQLDALWKWRWLGWRKSTPGFKASLVLLGGAGVALLVVSCLVFLS